MKNKISTQMPKVKLPLKKIEMKEEIESGVQPYLVVYQMLEGLKWAGEQLEELRLANGIKNSVWEKFCVPAIEDAEVYLRVNTDVY